MEMNGEQQLDAGIGFGEQNSFFRVQNHIPSCVTLSDLPLTLPRELVEAMSCLSLYLAESLILGDTHNVS